MKSIITFNHSLMSHNTAAKISSLKYMLWHCTVWMQP